MLYAIPILLIRCEAGGRPKSDLIRPQTRLQRRCYLLVSSESLHLFATVETGGRRAEGKKHCFISRESWWTSCSMVYYSVRLVSGIYPIDTDHRNLLSKQAAVQDKQW